MCSSPDTGDLWLRQDEGNKPCAAVGGRDNLPVLEIRGLLDNLLINGDRFVFKRQYVNAEILRLGHI